MSERVKCPSCGAGLILQESARDRWRRARVVWRNIRTGDGTRSRRDSDGEAGVASCRFLSALRPQCGGHLDNVPVVRGTVARSGTRRQRLADLDVRRDTKRTSCLVIGLAVIGGLGVGGLGLRR